MIQAGYSILRYLASLNIFHNVRLWEGSGNIHLLQPITNILRWIELRDRIGERAMAKTGGQFWPKVTHFSAPKAPKNWKNVLK